MPRSGFGDRYFHVDLFEMAAAYLYHLVQSHPFVDGNKRAGAMVAFVFMKLNGLTLVADEEEFETLVLDAAQGKADKGIIAQFFQMHAHV
jgi:death-on-curing protein